MGKFIKIRFSGEKGQAFPLALVVLAMGALFVSGFLTAVNTSFLTSDVYSDPIPDIYTADAGIEDAIWGLRYGTLADTVELQGGQAVYTLPYLINDTDAEITVSGSSGVIAIHTFELGEWFGGTGWLEPWVHQGSTTIITSQNPAEGTRHVQMRGANAYLKRSVNLSGYTGTKLQFWAKARSIDSEDKMFCKVSPDEINWTTVYEWNSDSSDDIYQYFDIDLSSFTHTSEFWIAFESDFDANNDYFYFDEIQITGGSSGYKITSIAGEKATTVTLDIIGGVVSILSWEIE